MYPISHPVAKDAPARHPEKNTQAHPFTAQKQTQDPSKVHPRPAKPNLDPANRQTRKCLPSPPLRQWTGVLPQSRRLRTHVKFLYPIFTSFLSTPLFDCTFLSVANSPDVSTRPADADPSKIHVDNVLNHPRSPGNHPHSNKIG